MLAQKTLLLHEQKRVTKKEEWEKAGCVAMKLPFPIYLCITINESKPHLVKCATSLNCTA